MRASPPSPPRSTTKTRGSPPRCARRVEAEPDEIHAAAFVLDSLRAAVWAVLHTTTFEGALVEIVNRGGDCDTVGAVAGALAGARYGADAIPARWLDALRRARAGHGGGRRPRGARRKVTPG